MRNDIGAANFVQRPQLYHQPVGQAGNREQGIADSTLVDAELVGTVC